MHDFFRATLFLTRMCVVGDDRDYCANDAQYTNGRDAGEKCVRLRATNDWWQVNARAHHEQSKRPLASAAAARATKSVEPTPRSRGQIVCAGVSISEYVNDVTGVCRC